MSDASPDPMDKAYAQAESVLNDEAARAERRARVLAAVASEPARAPVAASPPRLAWRRGGWLAAAGVAGLSVLLATRVYPPSAIQNPPPPPAAEVHAPEARAVPSPPAPTAEPSAATPRPVPRGPSAAPPAIARPAGAFAPSDAATARVPAPAPPTAVRVEEPPAAMVTPPASPAPPPGRSAETVVTAQRRAESLADAPLPRAPAQKPLGDIVVTSKAQDSASGDEGARLRAAAARNRTFELKTLLAEGARVDAVDAQGETALMKSVEAGHPAAAGILRRAGADLDLENREGRSARDMAAAKDDSELNKALGLDPPAPAPAPPR